MEGKVKIINSERKKQIKGRVRIEEKLSLCKNVYKEGRVGYIYIYIIFLSNGLD
jgi:hypothetical protein